MIKYRQRVSAAVLLFTTLFLGSILLGQGPLLANSAHPADRPADIFASSTSRSLPASPNRFPAGGPQDRMEAALRSSSVMFVENVGQFDERVRFQVRGGSGTLWLTEDGMWITLLGRTEIGDWRLEIDDAGDQSPTSNLQPPISNLQSPTSNLQSPISNLQSPISGVQLKLTFPGANPHPRLEPFNRLDTKVSYFIGNDPSKWRSGVPVWAGVRYVDLYPGVDLELTSRSGRWTWRLVCRRRPEPVEGSNCQFDLQDVRLRIEGADALALKTLSTVTITTAAGDVALPLLQAVTSRGTSLNSNVAHPTLAGNEIHTPFAGPIAASLDPDYNGGSDAFAVKLNASGDDLNYGTFLGGSGYDYGAAIAVDGSNSAYVAGWTYSASFDTTAGLLGTRANDYDVFVAKLNADGTALDYIAFMRGDDHDYGAAIAVDGSGSAYVAGWTVSADFPTTTGAFITQHSGYADAFVAKLNAGGTGLTYATFLGGSSGDYGAGIAVDDAGNAYVVGRTSSANFPATEGAFAASRGGGTDAFVAKLNGNGTALTYATFLGGSSTDEGHAIAVDADGNAYVAGQTRSADFPATEEAFSESHNGGTNDAFAAKLNAGGTGLTYATFLGGSDDDRGYAIAIDEDGDAYVAGATRSSDFPTTAEAFDTGYNGGVNDAFVVRLNAGGTGLAYATFLGGSKEDWGYAITVDGGGGAFVAGQTRSSDFPTTLGAFDTSYNGGTSGDAFVAKLFGPVAPPTPTPTLPPGVTPTATPPAQALIFVDPDHSEADPGGSTTVLARVAGLRGSLSAASIEMHYDPSVVRITDCTIDPNSAFDTGFCNPDFDNDSVEPDIVRFNVIAIAGLPDDFDLAEITFQTVGQSGDTTPLHLEVIAFSGVNGNPIPYTTQDGEVCITPCATPTPTSTSTPTSTPTSAGVQSANRQLSSLRSTTQDNPDDLRYATFLGGGSGEEGRAIAVDEAGSAYAAGVTYSYDLPTTEEATPTATPTSGPSPTPTSTPTATPTLAQPVVRAGSDVIDAPGGSTIVPVELLNMQTDSLGATTIEIRYDPSVLEATDCEAASNGLLGTCNPDYDNDDTDPDIIRLSLTSTDGISGDLFLLAEITFQAVGQAGDTSSLDVVIETFADPDGVPISVSDEDGEICVVSCPATPTPTVTNTPAPTATPTSGASPTATDTPASTATPTSGPSPTLTPTGTSTSGPSPTPTSTPTPTPTPTILVQAIVRAADGAISPDGSVTVPVEVVEMPAGSSLGGATVNLRYASSTLEVTACTPDPDGVFDLEFCNPNYDDGAVRFSVASIAGVSGDLRLAEITFQIVEGGDVQATGSSSLDVVVDTFTDPDGNPMSVGDQDGEICIAQCDAANYDFDGNGTVDLSDVQTVAGVWGSDAPDLRYDLDGDGDVDTVDIMRVVAAWGASVGS